MIPISNHNSKILIVGAGPTGLALSLALIQRNIPVRLIDEKDQPSVHSEREVKKYLSNIYAKNY